MADDAKMRGMNDARWLALLCTSRAAFTLIFTAYSALLPILLDAWQMTSARAGLVQSAWHVGYLLSLFGAGLLVDRIGPRATFFWMSGCACVFAAAFALCASGFWSGLVLYFLAGVASGGSYTPVLAIIARRFGPAQRGTAMGWYLAAASLGYAVSMFACSAAAIWAGWRAGLCLAAGATVVGALLGWIALRSSHDDRPHALSSQPWRIAVRRLWRNKPAQLAIGAYSFHCWELLGMWAWLPAFLVAVSMNAGEQQNGALATGAGLAGLTHLLAMAGCIAGGVLSDRIGRIRVILMMSCASLACSFSIGWFFGSTLWLVGMIAVLYNLTAIGDSAVFSTVLTETVPQDHIGFAFSVRSVLGFGMGAISPWVFGLVLDAANTTMTEQGAWGLAWTSLGIGAFMGPLLTLRLRGRIPKVHT